MTQLSKREMGYDSDPPRCFTCVYFRREPATPHEIISRKFRRGVKQVKWTKRSHPITNPIVDKCTFGHFETTAKAVCDEWHSRNGEVIE